MTIEDLGYNSTCPMCFDDCEVQLAHETNVKVSHPVGCPECVSKWMQQSEASCPICRISLKDRHIVEITVHQNGNRTITETNRSFKDRFDLPPSTIDEPFALQDFVDAVEAVVGRASSVSIDETMSEVDLDELARSLDDEALLTN